MSGRQREGGKKDEKKFREGKKMETKGKKKKRKLLLTAREDEKRKNSGEGERKVKGEKN